MLEENCVLQAPEHLNIKFFKDVLENGLREPNIEVKKINFSLGSSGGENYCSQIYRVKINYSTGNNGSAKDILVIVKSVPSTEATSFLELWHVFLKEKIFYTDILPRLEVLIGGSEKFGPRLYHSLKRPVNTLVFEDLSETQYVLACREKGLDEMHSRFVLQKIGKLHAISMLLSERDSSIMKHFRNGMLDRASLQDPNKMPFKFFLNSIDGLIDICSSWHGYENICTKLQKYKLNIKENLIRSQEPIEGEIKVLNHGDLWVNNVLFKYDAQRKIKDATFVDFQLSIFGSPGYDLNYFFNTSVQLDVLIAKRDDLIKEYYDSFSSTLIEQHYPTIPSLLDIQNEVRRREPYGFIALFGIFPAISMEKAESCDNTLENFQDEAFARKKMKAMFSAKRLQDTMRYSLRRFDSLGLWD